jgi:hypothetical protein
MQQVHLAMRIQQALMQQAPMQTYTALMQPQSSYMLMMPP